MKYLLTNEETARLKFRLLEESDFDNWEPLFREKNVATFLGLDPQLSSVELCQKWFNKVFHRYENDLGGMNVLIDKNTNAFIGQCGLLVQTVNGEERLEVGYSMLPQYWGMGYASEAAIKCKEYAFEHDFTDSLISVVHVDNIGSEKVALKNGMQLAMHLDDYDGMPVNIFEIDRAQYLKTR
ncbi:GNAT family N-acetyltransferase [bacterium SCSIO 12643]|nr:GNAT family N-acetyltransferase [bacterium SCSIO 12643]